MAGGQDVKASHVIIVVAVVSVLALGFAVYLQGVGESSSPTTTTAPPTTVAATSPMGLARAMVDPSIPAGWKTSAPGTGTRTADDPVESVEAHFPVAELARATFVEQFQTPAAAQASAARLAAGNATPGGVTVTAHVVCGSTEFAALAGWDPDQPPEARVHGVEWANQAAAAAAPVMAKLGECTTTPAT